MIAYANWLLGPMIQKISQREIAYDEWPLFIGGLASFCTFEVSKSVCILQLRVLLDVPVTLILNINSSLANGDKSPSYKICQKHTQSSHQACPT